MMALAVVQQAPQAPSVEPTAPLRGAEAVAGAAGALGTTGEKQFTPPHALGLPDGFGLCVNRETGEALVQTGPSSFEDYWNRVADTYSLRSAARNLLPDRKDWGTVDAKQRARKGTIAALWEPKARPDVSPYVYRVARCGRAMTGDSVGVWRSPEAKRAHYSGLVTCGSVWHCAVCALKIAMRRRAEMIVATQRHCEAGGEIGLLTCTVPHAADQSLAVVLERLDRLFKRLNSGKRSKLWRERWGVVGTVRALELTYGLNGWHPHTHSLVFMGRCAGARGLSDAGDELFERWAAVALREFGWKLPRIAVDLRGGASAADYVGKWGLELEVAGAALKKGKGDSRGTFELLRDYAEGTSASGTIWREFATTVAPFVDGAVASRQQLVWSRGLKGHFGINDRTDDEVAAAVEEPAVLLGELTFLEWRRVLAQPYDARLLVLQLATTGTFDDVRRYIQSLPEGEE